MAADDRRSLGAAISMYRPGRHAARVQVPLLVVVGDQDQSALAEPAMQAADRAPRGELLRLPGGHYAPFLEDHDTAVHAELAFPHRHLWATQPCPGTITAQTNPAHNR